MANPTPIYICSYGGTTIPGYVQVEDRNIEMKSADNSPLGRDGFSATAFRSERRTINLTWLLRSTLGNNVTDLQHLENVKTQYRSGLAILTRNPGFKQLKIHDTDRYYLAKTDGVALGLTTESSRNVTYNVKFSAQPWAIGTTAASTTFTGNSSPSIAIGDSRKTYPIFTIPSGVTAFTATDENSKVLQFSRLTNTGTITVDCGAMTAVNGSGVNATTSMINLGFGLYYAGTDGTYNFTVTGFAGSGTVNVDMYPRYEL